MRKTLENSFSREVFDEGSVLRLFGMGKKIPCTLVLPPPSSTFNDLSLKKYKSPTWTLGQWNSIEKFWTILENGTSLTTSSF